MIGKICKLIDERQDELFNLLSDLVKINSESFGETGNEKECAAYVHNLCCELGLDSELYSPLDIENFKQHPDYMPGRNLEERYNVSAVWKGETDKDELMLMAHTDTVEIGDPKNWESDPLSGEIKDGKIFGRGACDDKYAIATALFTIKLLKELGFTPKKNLVFVAYSDEELGGSHGALAGVLKNPCDNIVSMDGRDGEIWHCASGGGETSYFFHTKNIVDSAKLTASAFPVVMGEIEKFAANRKAELEANRFYNGTIIPETALRYKEVRAGNNGTDMGVGELKFAYYTDKTKEEIEAEFKAVEEEINKKLDPMGLAGDGFKPYTRFFHYGFAEPNSENIKLMVQAGKESTGNDIKVCGSCLSDLSIILKYGSKNAYGFGAGRDFSVEGGAHQPNEFIECDRLVDYTKTIAAYIIKVLG
ncbi:MAG: M20 family metallopeptidase [Clostridia bacterium]|nr:M20 family metallopeptidase [Clostridia bacterium]